MIIEIRDLPCGATIKSINCNIEFDGMTESPRVSVITSPAPVKAQPETRPEKIAPEMQEIEF